MLITQFDFSSIEKLRKSLVTVCVFTLLFAAVNFTSNNLSIFGLEIEINQLAFVETLRYAIGVLLFFFILRAAPALSKTWHRYKFLSDQHWEKKSKVALEEQERELHDPSGRHDEWDEDWDSWFYKERWQRKLHRQRLLESSNKLISIVGMSLDYLIPIIVSVLVIFRPFLLVSVLELGHTLSSISFPP